MIGVKYNKWIFILQEFDLDFVSKKSKKLLFFVEFMSNLPSLDKDEVHKYYLVNEHIFLILITDP